MSKSNFRAHAVIGVSLAWGVGASMSCSLAYFTISTYGWRGYILSNAILFSVTVPLTLLIPESIRFDMVSRCREDLAVKSLKRLYKLNFKSYPGYTFKDLNMDCIDNKERLTAKEILEILSQKDNIRNIILFTGIAFSTIVVYYVSAYATPRFVNEGYCSDIPRTVSESCIFINDILLKIMIISMIEPVGVIVALILVSIIGRRKGAGLFVLAVFLSCLLLYFCGGSTYLNSTLTFLKGSSAGLAFIPFLMCTEYFPTQIRGFTQSILVTAGRIGGVVGISMVQGVYNYSPRMLIGITQALTFFSGIMLYQLKKETLGIQIY